MATTGTPRRTGPTAPAAPRPPARTGNGSGNGKGRPAPRRKKSRFWSRVKTFFLTITFFLLVAIVTLVAWVGWRIHNAPRTIDLSMTPLGITYIYSSDGTPLAEFFTERRKVVPIEDIPQYLQDATVAFEDKRFYQHKGVDLRGIARAFSSNLHHGDMKGEGGSTITQQLARNMGVEGLTRQKSIGRKFNELIIASQIENSYTKQDILAMYLNQVNYGSGAYGVEAAAEVYFNKHVKQLDLAQCALLAGLPNRPNDFTPYKDMDAAKAQRGRVLQQMLEQGKIKSDQYQQAVNEPIKLAGAKPPSQGSQIFHAPYFVNYVVDQFRRTHGSDRLFEGNLKIYTTLNWPMQQIAERELQNGIANAHEYGATQGALVALDPQTGEIKAMVGGVDYKKTQINYATHGRQPGSSFKPIVYSAAFNENLQDKQQRNYSEWYTVYDGPGKPFPLKTASGYWTPQDDSGYSYRDVTLRTAVADSINIPAVRVLSEIGPNWAVVYGHRMGIKAYLDPVPSLALGSSPVSPLEMASAYSTFADAGSRPEPSAWTRLTDGQDAVVEDVPPVVETKVLEKKTVDQIDDMLKAVVTEGTAKGIEDMLPEARGKTGTTQDHKDVWFVGYTPDLVCAVWAGHPIYRTKNQPAGYGEAMAHDAFGRTISAPIWAKFMSQAIPVFQSAKAREAELARKKQGPVAKPVTAAETAAAISSDAASSSNSDSAPPERHRLRKSKPRDNGDGTVTVPVDDSTNLLAPEGSPGSHLETFSAGTEPTTLSPQYTVNPDNADGGSQQRERGQFRRFAAFPGCVRRTAPAASQPASQRQRHRDRQHQPGRRVAGDQVGPADGHKNLPARTGAARIQPDVFPASRRTLTTG